MKKDILKNKKGSALLIAIVIMMVVTMLSLALLLVSYSLFATSNKQNQTQQCRTLAQSLSRELEAEITIASFDKYADQRKAMEEGTYPLWFYLRFNILQNNWPYFNDEERGHTQSYAYRYFDIDVSALSNSEAAALMDDISVLMYWESGAENDRSGTELVIQVTCKIGDQQSTVTSTYQLVIDEKNFYTDIASTGVTDSGQLATIEGSDSVNPSNNSIYPAEIWSWGLMERE